MLHESLTQFDIGWIVGILEGEGCFGAYSDKRRPTTFSVKIQMESTDHDVVLRLNKLIPGRVWESNYPSKTKNFPSAKDSWRWAISDKNSVKSVINLIYPYMSVRRQEQLNKVLSHCEYKYPRKVK